MSDCLQELLGLGHQLEDVLPAMTSNPAKLLKLSRKGQITMGSDADFLVLDDANNISDVMVRGSWHIRNNKILKKGQFETD